MKAACTLALTRLYARTLRGVRAALLVPGATDGDAFRHMTNYETCWICQVTKYTELLPHPVGEFVPGCLVV